MISRHCVLCADDSGNGTITVLYNTSALHMFPMLVEALTNAALSDSGSYGVRTTNEPFAYRKSAPKFSTNGPQISSVDELKSSCRPAVGHFCWHRLCRYPHGVWHHSGCGENLGSEAPTVGHGETIQYLCDLIGHC